MAEKLGILYIVATPIGNLEDITFRALYILKEVYFVYAEDTRVSGKLLAYYQISKPMRSYREAMGGPLLQRTIDEISQHLEEGQDIAYVSDAGTPGISDPGSYLVDNILSKGYQVVPIPGPSSMVTLLSGDGFPAQRPLMVGFLPKKKGHQTLMQKLKAVLLSETADSLVFMESPERLLKLLEELQKWQLPLIVGVGRELTKLFEEIKRGELDEVMAYFAGQRSIKGEIVLIVRLAVA